MKDRAFRWDGVNDARKFLRAMKEFSDQKDLLYRLVKPEVSGIQVHADKVG
jgi:hypothetical protein